MLPMSGNVNLSRELGMRHRAGIGASEHTDAVVAIVSEETGFQKPRKEFYDYVFARIPDFAKSRALMVGDSLSSDMEGARNAGVDACWYNPKGKTAPSDLLAPTGPIRYEIRELMELAEILAAA